MTLETGDLIMHICLYHSQLNKINYIFFSECKTAPSNTFIFHLSATGVSKENIHKIVFFHFFHLTNNNNSSVQLLTNAHSLTQKCCMMPQKKQVCRLKCLMMCQKNQEDGDDQFRNVYFLFFQLSPLGSCLDS